MTTERPVIGLVPAAGWASRISPLPFSKELFPVGISRVGTGGQATLQPVCCHLLRSMALSGIERALVVLRKGKWDIPGYLGDGAMLGMHLAYAVMRDPFGIPWTLETAYPFVRDHLVAFGFPDIVFRPVDIFGALMEQRMETDADLVLGLFPVAAPSRWHMAEADAAGKVGRIHMNPERTTLRYAWITALWAPAFTEFMHVWVARQSGTARPGKEVFLSEVFQSAVEAGLRVQSVAFETGTCADIGSPGEIAKWLRNGLSETG